MNLWPSYYEKKRGCSCNDLLIDALGIYDEQDYSKCDGRRALDIGCGNGQDTLKLLQHNFHVTALDPEIAAKSELLLTIPDSFSSQYIFINSSLEDFQCEPFEFVNAISSLFFCNPENFHKAWERLVTQLPTGAMFCGDFMGGRDDWANRLFTIDEVDCRNLFDSFEIIRFMERFEEGDTAMQQTKTWHTFEVIARKR